MTVSCVAMTPLAPSREWRLQILGTYRVAREASGTVRRVDEGNVSVDIAVVSSRIERGIVAEIAKTLPNRGCLYSGLDRSVLNPGNSSGIIMR